MLAVVPGRNGLRFRRVQNGLWPSCLSMPYARSGALRVYYESTGRGPAVLLILGQGMSLESGWRTVERLSQSLPKG